MNDETNTEFGSSKGTDDAILTPNEHLGETAAEQSDTTKGFIVSESGEHSNDEQQHEDSDDFGSYEEFFKDFANEHDLTYNQEEDDYDFKISLKAEENTTLIQIDHGRNLIMTAKDNNGETVVPDQKMFDAIAELAQQQGNSITFGNITTPKYAARLYIACQKQQPPIEMIGMLEINDEFLGKLDSETKEQIEMLVAQETESKEDQTYDKAPTESQEEVSSSTSSFAASELQEKFVEVRNKMPKPNHIPKEQDSLNKEQNNPNSKKAPVSTIPDRTPDR